MNTNTTRFRSMTDTEYLKELYTVFLAKYCGCYVDAVGNMPCDNGCVCDKCSTQDAIEAWILFREDRMSKRISNIIEL